VLSAKGRPRRAARRRRPLTSDPSPPRRRAHTPVSLPDAVLLLPSRARAAGPPPVATAARSVRPLSRASRGLCWPGARAAPPAPCSSRPAAASARLWRRRCDHFVPLPPPSSAPRAEKGFRYTVADMEALNAANMRAGLSGTPTASRLYASIPTDAHLGRLAARGLPYSFVDFGPARALASTIPRLLWHPLNSRPTFSCPASTTAWIYGPAAATADGSNRCLPSLLARARTRFPTTAGRLSELQRKSSRPGGWGSSWRPSPLAARRTHEVPGSRARTTRWPRYRQWDARALSRKADFIADLQDAGFAVRELAATLSPAGSWSARDRPPAPCSTAPRTVTRR
jgi:hypothetical protein